MMILQGVRHLVPYLGVSYANDPKKGGYMAYVPALDLTTLFEVIFQPLRKKGVVWPNYTLCREFSMSPPPPPPGVRARVCDAQYS